MSQAQEALLEQQLFCVRCSDVGLDCNCTIFGFSRNSAVDSAITHMLEYHAIRPEEMTTCMRLKIMENMRIYYHSTSSPPWSASVY
jgi:predicted small metal-binding protein